MRQILQCLLESKLFIKAEKCEFHVDTVVFLGYIITQGNLKPDPVKVRAVLDWPQPSNRRQLQCFLGFANFYRWFVQNFSQIALPLTSLTSPKECFQWDQEAQLAFTDLKERFATSPILRQLNQDQQFVVEVNASESGVGAVLSQCFEGKLHPCAFFSPSALSRRAEL